MKPVIPAMALRAALRGAVWAAMGAGVWMPASGATELPAPAAAAQPRAPTEAPNASREGARDARSYFTDLELLTQEGRKVRFYSDVLEGRTVLINVIYANCKDACPLITQQLNEVRRQIPDLFGKRVFFVTLSSDPMLDTPQILKQFAQKQGADVAGWTFLTGSKENMDQVLKKLGQYAQNKEEHSTGLIAGNVGAKRWAKLRPDLPPAAIAQRLSTLADAGALGAP